MKKSVCKNISQLSVAVVAINLFGFLTAFSPYKEQLKLLRYTRNGKAISRTYHSPSSSSPSLYNRRKLQLYSEAKDIVTAKDSTNGIAQDTEDAEEYGRSQLQQYFSFPIDGWQAKAGGEVLKDKNVIVCTPTGMFECYWIQLQSILFYYFCTTF